MFQAMPLALRLETQVSRSKVLMFITSTGSCFSNSTPGTNPPCTTRTWPMPGMGPRRKITGQDDRYSICFLLKELANSRSADSPRRGLVVSVF